MGVECAACEVPLINQFDEDYMKILNSILPHGLMAMLLASFVAITHAQAPTKAADGVLINAAGMTLYVFDADPAGKSTCNGPCAGTSPAASPTRRG